VSVLSLQSHVVYGHVGNSVAAFVLQYLGFEVWAVPTVVFSNHPAHGGYRGAITPAGQIADLVTGLDERGVLGECETVLSGYLGTAENGKAVLETVARVRAANPGALYICDPVMAHEDGFFVDSEIQDVMRELVRAADVVLPNATELAFLADGPVDSVESACAAAAAIRRTGPGMVLCTSLPLPEGKTGTLLVEDDTWLVATPWLEGDFHGAGDLFAALFTAHHLADLCPGGRLGLAVSATYAVLKTTAELGGGELALIEAQDELEQPFESYVADLLTGPPQPLVDPRQLS
jgi:pyridoxine kinase